MKKRSSKSAEELRRRAEKQLQERKQKSSQPHKSADFQRLTYELEVHQLELEMQNEQLQQAHAELEAFLNQYTDLYDFAPVGYFTLESDGTIIQVNLTGAQLLGMERSALTKRRFGLFIAAEHRRSFNSFLGNLFRDKTPKTCEVVLHQTSAEPTYVHLAGRIFESEQRCRLAVVDITERKQMEERLKESEDKYRSLIDQSMEMLYLHNLDGNFLEVNKAAATQTGYSRDELLRLNVFDLHWDKSKRENILKQWQDWPVGKSATMETNHKCKNGTILPVEVTTCKVSLGGKEYILALARNITERKQAEEKFARYTASLEKLYNQQQEEMEKARRIHERTMPKILPEVEGISLAAHYQPAQKLGGDFYNVIQVGQKLVLYLSDVTGHGLDGTMLSVFIKEAIDSYLSLKPEAVCPRKILHHLDRQYRSENYPDDYFISIFLGVLDLKTNVLRYASAGFQTSPLVCLGNKVQCELPGSGLPIMDAISPELLEFKENSITLTPGSTIFFSTDGLPEQTVKGELYNERLNKVFYQYCFFPPEAAVHAVNEDFRIFNNGLLQGDDDITFLVLQIDPKVKETRYLEVQSDFEELDKIREEVIYYLPDRPQAQMLAAGAYELAANAVEHGNKLDPEKKVTVKLTYTDEYACAVVEDEGEGFNWIEKINAPLELKGIAERGRGIAITRKHCKKLLYDKKGNKATLFVKL